MSWSVSVYSPELSSIKSGILMIWMGSILLNGLCWGFGNQLFCGKKLISFLYWWVWYIWRGYYFGWGPKIRMINLLKIRVMKML
ncbi:MAG: hypothetical protein Hyperionvirus15_14 [Hyperionvirus sp.]|uniref:Uncharacterized protein n=1 Tax=Hyperionvirus sp. TaxID=2487770 RepID=A0A3G5A9M6_9VIRU|nr:MAG: hypothetical protein Hyperionvirus15_14 [Hyperionvirus sp.]